MNLDDFEVAGDEEEVSSDRPGMLQKLVRATHPGEQCDAVGKGGQCPYKVVEGTGKCQRHGGTQLLKAKDVQKSHDYRLQVWQQRVDEFSASEKVTSLSGEIAILRMLLEQTLNQCSNATELVIYSPRIADLATRIERLVLSFDKVTTRTSNLLTKGAALNLGAQIVDIITKHVQDSNAIDKISNDIIDVVVRLAGKDME